jgi:ubiquinone/menaquinone biosynthesis C-methylase UbiE
MVSTDISYNALLIGEKISQFLNTKIDCYATSKIEKIPFENQYFDYVIGSAVLQQTKPEESVKEIFRVLKEGGKYVGIWSCPAHTFSSIWESLWLQGKTARHTKSLP